jgi:peptidoglycan/LPS O-acetylase OafA/YrhL
VWWSLATEVQFYLVLPLLPLFLRSRGGRRVGAAIALTYAMAYAAFALGAMHLGSFEANNRLVHSLLGRAPLFVFGALAAVLYERKGEQLKCWATDCPRMRRGGADALLLLVLLALGMLLRHIVYFDYSEYEVQYPAWHLIEGSLWTMTVLLVLLAPLRTRALLSNPILRTLGLLSYSIYLIHLPVLMFGLAAVRTWWPRPNLIAGWTLRSGALFVLLCASFLALSTVTYLTIERPMLRRKARLRRWSEVPRARDGC